MVFEVHDELGHYRVEERLGIGGMGMVMLGRHILLNRPVAMKIRQRTQRNDDNLLAERFRQGAILQAELRHPHIARILDYFETEQFQVIIMDLLGGGTVEHWLNEHKGALPISEAIEVGIRVGRALHYAHQCGVIHRDLKPSNLILASEGKADTVSVTDFGVAKAPDRSPDLTVAGANVGTLWYMSPEQLSHEDATPQADVYSLGATIYELLTGHVPFEEAETSYVFRRFLDGDPLPPITSRNPKVPENLATLVEAALELDMSKRIETARFFSWALYCCAAREQVWLSPELASHYTADELQGFRRELSRLPKRLAESLEASLPRADQLESTELLALSSILPSRTVDVIGPTELSDMWQPAPKLEEELLFEDDDVPTGVVEAHEEETAALTTDEDAIETTAFDLADHPLDDDDDEADETLISVVVCNDEE